MEVWTGFIVGLVGSVHCVGMCGPIVISLPGQQLTGWSFWLTRTLYNFGRVLTYTILGVVVGLIGRSVRVGEYQQTLSIILGILIILAVFLPSRWISKYLPFIPTGLVTSQLKKYWTKLFRASGHGSMFLIGILNGFLPCGFVYIGLAGALSTGTTLDSAAYMMLFGLGTIPILLATSWAGKVVSINIRRYVLRLLPAAAVILGVLFILRGMSLGIPYVSPKISQTNSGQQQMECCH